MHLNIIKSEKWQVCEVCDHQGNSPLLAWLDDLNPKYDGSKKRLLAIINRVSTGSSGPNLLNTDISHEVDKNECIYEFIAGDLRLLWFYSNRQRRMIICGCQHLKKTRKVNKKEVRALEKIKYPTSHPVSGPSLAAPQSGNPRRGAATPVVSLNRRNQIRPKSGRDPGYLIFSKALKRIIKIKKEYVSAYDAGDITYFDSGEQL